MFVTSTTFFQKEVEHHLRNYTDRGVSFFFYISPAITKLEVPAKSLRAFFFRVYVSYVLLLVSLTFARNSVSGKKNRERERSVS